MNDYIPGTKMPIYILDQLKNKNENVLIPYSCIKEYGEKEIIRILASQGLRVKLEISTGSFAGNFSDFCNSIQRKKQESKNDTQLKYPRDANYILVKI